MHEEAAFGVGGIPEPAIGTVGIPLKKDPLRKKFTKRSSEKKSF